jgi:prepilin-type N-terminal cleavage/methylation domain-containing protein
MVTRAQHKLRAFTLIELLVVIAIIAILAAILFPVFAVVREQARQSNTMSSLHAAYVGSKMFFDDEGHFPNTLFPYAETISGNAIPPLNRPMISTVDLPAVQMSLATGFWITSPPGQTPQTVERGFVFPEQMKDAITFANADNLARTQFQVTTVYWPLNSQVSINLGGTAANPIPVTWQTPSFAAGCPTQGDSDIPMYNGLNYAGAAKVYYFMDSMDIGPMLNTDGTIIYFPGTQNPRYELHYSPDWTHEFGVGCDMSSGGVQYVTELKYANPPSDRTLITYVTQHVATAESSKVLALTLNGNVRKVDVKVAGAQFPLNYTP